jgi:hypothetical protein
MFSRLAARLDPCPPWVTHFCAELGVVAEADPEPLPIPSAAASGPVPLAAAHAVHTAAYAPPPPGEMAAPSLELDDLAAEVIDWLQCHGVKGAEVELGLTCLPTSRLVSRDSQRLELNLLPLLQGDDWLAATEQAMEAFMEPLRQARQAAVIPRLAVRDAASCIQVALGHLLRTGEALPLATYGRLNLAMAVWRRLSGPGHLGARLLANDLPPVPLERGALLVQLDATELAALQSVLYKPGELPQALAQLRRNHLNDAYWSQQDENWWCRPDQPEENLRRLHRDSGFYAAAGEAMGCLRRWADGSFRCLAGAAVWSGDPTAASFFLPVAQALFSATGVVPEPHARLDLRDLYRLMAGREVLYVGPHGAAVLDQHRSGRAFRLFVDQVIEPYGLRVVAPPESRYPQRPERGFSASLDGLIQAVEAEYGRKPFALLLADCGAYRLPLLEHVASQLGVRGVALAQPLAPLFGLDLAGVPRWRPEKRAAEHWRPAAAALEC